MFCSGATFDPIPMNARVTSLGAAPYDLNADAMGEPKRCGLLNGDLHLLDGSLFQAKARNSIGQSFGQVVLRFFHQSDDPLLDRAVIHSVFNIVTGGGRSQIRPQDEIDQDILFLTPFLVAQAEDAPEHQILN
jgi:hypothetical protein